MKAFRFACVVASWSRWAALWVALTACSGDAGSGDQASLPLPTGHYEGPISYQGSELRVALDLRESTPGHLQAELSFPQSLGLGFEAARLHYQEPQLRLEQQLSSAGGIRVQAVREGDFLRGVLHWDSLRSDFVWVRRGEATPRGFREQELLLRYAGHTATGQLLLPDDTLSRHPALALLATPTMLSAAQARAVYLARRGFVTLVVPTPAAAATPDSATYHATLAALGALRRQTAVDSGQVGCWVRGALAAEVAGAVAQGQPQAAFLVLESAPASTRAEAAPYQGLGRQRIPVLALYAGLDTTLQVRESARRMRNALAYRRGTQVRTFPQATPDFLQPGRTTPDGQWQWPTSAPGYWESLEEWLRQTTAPASE